ncbi:glucosaminidase domain-containing protein [Patulibacter defluvii]|uniref:glucosaminidase domain-containing protein n=1 Tax=Patulibacter defluvii TaxID=3095358 RepID=UPI002A7525FA|nr:glucosaminidase domain-containing protein [Patulibacter sp. DM4]
MLAATVAAGALATIAAGPAAAASPTGPGGTALAGPAAGSPPNGPSERRAAGRATAGLRQASSRPSNVGTIKLQSSRKIKVRYLPNQKRTVGSLKNGATVKVLCQMNSVRASGYSGTSRIWDRVRLPSGRHGYVPDASVQNEKTAMVAHYCRWSEPGPPADVNPQQGRCGSYATVPLVAAPANRAAFIATAGPLAQASSRTTQVPASVTLAQAILESASGTATAGANNYFGIKAQAVDSKNGIYRWATEAVGCVLKPTYESESGRLVRQLAAFRMYRGMQDSFDDHGLFLRQNSRYAKAFDYSDDPERFAKEVHKAGYATDPAYSNSLIRLMRNEKLTRYDR